MFQRPFIAFVLPVLAVLCLSLPLAAFQSLKEATEDAAKTEAAIKTEVGTEAEVGANVSSGTNGQRTYVTVHFKTPPKGDLETIKQ